VLKFTVTLPRRKFLGVAVVAVAPPALPPIAPALDYPTRTVRVIVPFAPGGPLDVFGRLMAEKLSEHFREQFYIENIGGAGGNIGTSRAAKAAPDGYTLLLTANNHIINPLLYESVPYDAFKDFEPVTLAVGFSTALSVNPSVPARTLAELVALVRVTPRKYSYAESERHRIFWASDFGKSLTSISCTFLTTAAVQRQRRSWPVIHRFVMQL
jgi:tripartite-type tricarboxylate transporter receptor subunit TctC